LFIVESPLQILNAIEAKYFFRDATNVLVVAIWSKEGSVNSIQMEELISQDCWTDIIRFKSCPSRILPFRLWSKLRRRYNIKRVFVGDIGSTYMRLALAQPGQENFLLDDGVATIFAQDWFLRRESARVSFYDTPYDYSTLMRHNIKVPSWKTWFKKQIHNMLVPVNIYSGDINLFTAFDLQPVGGQKIIKNRYESLKLKKTDKTIDSSMVWFFGHELSEDGGLSLEEEVGILKQIVCYYASRGIRVHYLPHRKENVQRLDLFKENLGMVIEAAQWPAEIETVFRNRLPAHIGAYTSTVLVTLPLLHDFETVTSFRVDAKIPDENEALDKYLSAHVCVVDLNTESI